MHIYCPKFEKSMQQTQRFPEQTKQRDVQRFFEALRESQAIIIQMRDKYVALEKQYIKLSKKQREFSQQLKQKNSIIQKLLMQKQQKMFSPLVNASQPLKDHLDQVNKYYKMSQDNCNSIIEHYQAVLKKDQVQFMRLKELNKIIRTENTNLKAEVKRLGQMLSGTRRAGMITSFRKSNTSSQQNSFKITFNQHQNQIQKSSEKLFTPERINKWNSTVLPSTASRIKTPPQSVELIRTLPYDQHITQIPSSIFQNQSIRQASLTKYEKSTQLSSTSTLNPDMQKWLKRLGNLLQDSDGENEE